MEPTPRKNSTHAISAVSNPGEFETHVLVDAPLAAEINGTFEYDVPLEVYLHRLLLPSDERRRGLLQRRIDAVLAALDSPAAPDSPAALDSRAACEVPTALLLPSPPAHPTPVATLTPTAAAPVPLRSADGWAGCTSYQENVFLPAFVDLWRGIVHLSCQTQVADQDDNVLSLPLRDYRENRTRYLAGSNARRKLDFYVCDPAGRLEWKDVLMFAEMKNWKSSCSLTQVNLQMAGYAREIVFSQPDRRFVHAMYFDNALVSLYRFDRCGALVSCRFDFHQDWKFFVRVILAYSYMDREDLGFDLTMIPLPNPIPIASAEVDPNLNTEMELACRPPPTCYTLRMKGAEYCLDRILDSHKTLIGRATVCWEARRLTACSSEARAGVAEEESFVIKRAWRQGTQSSEEKIYMIAKDKGVPGLLDLQLELCDPAVTTVLERVRRHCSGLNKRPRLKRKVNAMTEDADGETWDEGGASKGSRTSKSNSMSGRGSRSLSAFAQAQEVSQQVTPITAVGSEVEGIDTTPDRVCVHLVFRNAVGVPLGSITSPRRVFAAILSALRTHRALYTQQNPADVQILHRDISVGNILATTDQTQLTRRHGDDDEPLAGMLIDFDHAITMEERVTGACNRTGTDAFVAVSVLYGAYNSYRADLESFFYVICWVCCRLPHRNILAEHLQRINTCKAANTEAADMNHVQFKAPGPPKKPLEEWTNGDEESKAHAKVRTVSSQVLFRDRVIKKLTPTYQCAAGLLYALRAAVKDSPWFTRDDLSIRLEERKAEAENLQQEWLKEHPGVMDRAQFMESPIAAYEKQIVLEEDVDGDRLFFAMEKAIQSRLDSGDIVE